MIVCPSRVHLAPTLAEERSLPALHRIIRRHYAPVTACAPGSDGDSGGVLAEGRLESLALPVMLIAGTASPRAVHAINEALAARLWDVGVASVEGAGHMCPVTHPAQVAGLIGVNVTRG